jgi:hypothetical protein
MHTGFWCGKLKGRDRFEEISIDRRTKSKKILR